MRRIFVYEIERGAGNGCKRYNDKGTGNGEAGCQH